MTSIYDNWMRKLREEDDDLAGPEEQAALLSYLNGVATADAAAHDLLKGATDPGSRTAGLVLNLLIDAAEEIPEAHPRLLELLDAIGRSSTAKMDEFTFELHDAFNGLESASQSSHSTSNDERHFINLCAFIARFWHHRQGNWADWAMQLLHDGLEEDHGKTLTDLFGLAVAQLFLFSCSEIYALSQAAQASGHRAGPLLPNEGDTATRSHWEFWKRKLSQLKESESLGIETREAFGEALGSMAKVEAKG